jgi:hypothetical protein
MRNPAMVTPAAELTLDYRGSRVGLRNPMSLAGSRVQSVQSVEGLGQVEGFGLDQAEDAADMARKRGEQDAEDVVVAEKRRENASGQLELDGLGSSRLDGSRSTVSYLQVQRPATMMFADEIRLRKDEFGVYRVVVNGGEFVA